MVITYVVIMLFFVLCYKLHAAAFIYVFCLLHAASTLVNQLSYIIASIIATPDTKISILSFAPYSLLMIGLTLLCAPFFYWFCRKSLGEAFEILDTKNIWQLCIVPIIFFIIFQFTLPIMVQFNGSSSVFLLLILLFAAAISTYVVNLHAVMNGTKTMRLRCIEQEQRILITVDNSLEGDFSGFQKGIGLQSVSAVAESYSGNAKFEASNGVFKASVILHFP